MAAALIGLGSAVLHPESSRVARMAAGKRPGLAQSLFQMGGNIGASIGPLFAAVVVSRHGQGSVAWFALAAVLGMVLLFGVGRWYASHGMARIRAQTPRDHAQALSRRRVIVTLGILVALMLSKFVYTASVTSYYTFYLTDRFAVPVRTAQLYLFVYMASVAIGTLVGGSLGDRFGRKFVIWFSILGVLPFTLVLPYANLFWAGVLMVPIGLILASAFPAIVVYGQELVPFRVGTVAGLFFGLAFGLGGIGAALLGQVADATGIQFVFQLCSFLPVIGLLAAFLRERRRRARRQGVASLICIAAQSPRARACIWRDFGDITARAFSPERPPEFAVRSEARAAPQGVLRVRLQRAAARTRAGERRLGHVCAPLRGQHFRLKTPRHRRGHLSTLHPHRPRRACLVGGGWVG